MVVPQVRPTPEPDPIYRASAVAPASWTETASAPIPAETEEQKKARAYPFFKQAITDYNASNFLGAIRGYSEYLKIREAFEVRFNRGAAYNRLGQAELALADYEQALRLKPDDAMALEEVAKIKAKLFQKAETLTSISQVTDMKVTDAGYRELQSLIERYAVAGLTTDRRFSPNAGLTIEAYEVLTANGLKALRQMASVADISDARFAELFGLDSPKPKAVDGALRAGEAVNSLKYTFGPSTLKAISPDKPISRGYFVMLLNEALNHGADKLSLNSNLDGTKTGPITMANTAKAKELVDQGLQLIGKRDYEGAIRLFNQALDSNREYIDAYRYRAIAALLIYEQNPTREGQKLYMALNNLEDAIKRGASKPDDFYLRGKTKEHLGQKSDAISDYRKALTIYPDFQPAKDALAKGKAMPIDPKPVPAPTANNKPPQSAPTRVNAPPNDESRFKQIILDIAMGKSVPPDDIAWANRYEQQKKAGGSATE